jgi:alanine racemase
MTHFACADTGEAPSIDEQLDRFDAATRERAGHGF